MFDFADINRDGMLDMVFYEPTQGIVYTLYNKHKA